MKQEKEKKENKKSATPAAVAQEEVKISIGLSGIDVETKGMSAEKTNALLNKVAKKHGVFMKFKRNKIPLGVN